MTFSKGLAIATCVIVTCVSASLMAQEYTHERVAVMPYIIAWLGLNDEGGYWYTGGYDGINGNLDLYINGANYTGNRFPGWHQAGAIRAFGDGTVIWIGAYEESGDYYEHLFIDDHDYSAALYGASSWVADAMVNSNRETAARIGPIGPWIGGPYDVWVGAENRTASALGYAPDREAHPVALGDDGRLYWSGTRQYRVDPEYDWYIDDTNISAEALGANRSINTWDPKGFQVNASGQYAWHGFGDRTSGRYNVFLGQENFSLGVFGTTNHQAYLKGLDDSGRVIWHGHRLGERVDVYRDTTNLSSWLGDDRSVGWEVMVSRSGSVLWSASSSLYGSGNHDVFFEQTNLSSGLLGESRSTVPLDFTGDDKPLWLGMGTMDAGLFVGDFNLTRDALGEYIFTRFEAVTGNTRGQVLWLVRRPGGTGEMYELWLSTPVPEPSALLLALPLPLLLRRRKRTAG